LVAVYRHSINTLMDGFTPTPHTPGREQVVTVGQSVKIVITDLAIEGLFNVESYDLRVSDTKPFGEFNGIDLETLLMILEMLPVEWERRQQEYADDLPQN